MGLIIECYAIDPQHLGGLDHAQCDIDLARGAGIAVGSLSINSSAPADFFDWLGAMALLKATTPADLSSCQVIAPEHLRALIIKLETTPQLAPDMANFLIDAAEETQWRQLALWIGIA